MSLADEPSFGHRWRAPRHDRAFLADPPLAQAESLVAGNRARRAQWESNGLSDLPWAALASVARRELVLAARAHSATYLDPAAQPAGGPLILAGHQPGMFHPGVWCKNFLIDAVARVAGGTAINLVINTDTLRRPALRVPSGTAQAPHWETIPFDEATDEMPFEERRIVDANIFASFGERARQAMATLASDSLLEKYWALAVERAQATGNLGRSLSESRHRLEREWGLATWEIPWSDVIELPATRRLTGLLLADACRLRGHYNDAIRAYRQVYHVRSRNHPAPLLELNGDWCEAPYRVWRADSPRRQRLFVRRRDDDLQLTDRAGWTSTLPAPRDAEDSRTAAALEELARKGVKIRTRALATTLYARVLFADLFVHGIGGGLYDQVTDRWMWRAWGIVPPDYLVATATLFLPLAGTEPMSPPPRFAAMRELTYHPERFLQAADLPREAQHALEQKRNWIATEQTRENARERCRAIRGANEFLQRWLAAVRLQWTSAGNQAGRRRAVENVARWREYGFPLYPETTLRDFLLEIPLHNV